MPTKRCKKYNCMIQYCKKIGDDDLPVLQALIDKFLLKPFGFIIALLIASFVCIQSFPSENESYTKFIATSILCVIILIVYISILVYINMLPKAKKGQLGVLFIIHTENNNIFEEAKFNLVDNFKNIVNKYDTNFTAKCLNASNIKNYNLGDKSLIKRLLEKTNCFFSVDIVYQVDSVNNTSNYQLKINTATIHPRLPKSFIAILRGELFKASEPIKNLKFTKDQKLEKLEITVEQLSYIVKYILGLTLFLDGSNSYAIALFDELYRTNITTILPNLSISFNKLYYNICLDFESECIDDFHDTQDSSKLDIAEYYLNRMNELFPDTYAYHLDAAMLSFVKYKNTKDSIQHINFCRSQNNDDAWKYSDAFLTAYTTLDINLICKKYEEAIKSDYNIMNIITFVENALSDEPEKYTLHLALAILYHTSGDKQLMASHLKKFQSMYSLKPSDKTYRKFLNEFNPNCIECKTNFKCSSCTNVA